MQASGRREGSASRMPADPRLLFGQRLRELRTAQGYSQEEFADRAQLDRTYISGIERGRRNVSLVNIWRLATALGVPPPALLELPANLPAAR
jgi:transcriptional regulator with XRE-family HTH domain